MYQISNILWDILEGDSAATAINKHAMCAVSKYLLETMDGHNMLQFNKYATCNNNVLDLVFGNNVDMEVKNVDFFV